LKLELATVNRPCPLTLDISLSDSARIWAEALPAASRLHAASANAIKNDLRMEDPDERFKSKTARGDAAGRPIAQPGISVPRCRRWCLAA
jgi:hypothetical protein